jgi:DNA-binding transcriptional ArsR family regulator
MNKVKEDLLLHPVRLRIILAIAGRQLTAQELANELPDVPQATLYRNINTLRAGGILCVVKERRVRNTIQRTYALPDQDLLLTTEDLENAQPEDYIRVFTQYLGLLLGYYVRYIQQGDVDFTRDNLIFRMFSLYLNEEETTSVGQSINAALQPYLNNKPSPDRPRSIFGLVYLPDVIGVPLPTASETDPLTAETFIPSKEKEINEKTNYENHK